MEFVSASSRRVRPRGVSGCVVDTCTEMAKESCSMLAELLLVLADRWPEYETVIAAERAYTELSSTPVPVLVLVRENTLFTFALKLNSQETTWRFKGGQEHTHTLAK